MREYRSLDERLKRLERSRRLSHTLLLVLAAAALAGSSGAGSTTNESVIAAEAFHLVDSKGNIVAELALGPEGPGFFIRDLEGRDRIKLVHESEQTGLFVLDESGHSRIGIAQFSHGGGGVALHGPEAKGAAVLYLKGSGSLSFYDDDGNVTHRAPEREK